ncbi:MAG: hypothetical protein ABI847_12930, partial [Anaerolineales bacterium]
DFYWIVPAGSPTAEPIVTTPVAVVPGASFTSAFTVTVEGDTAFGQPRDLHDGQTVTWASLRGGGAWVLTLQTPAVVAGVRLTAHRDGQQDSPLLGVDLSSDGAIWTPVFAAGGACGETAGCLALAQNVAVDIGFAPSPAQYVRLRGGARFALAEVELAVLP